MGLEGFAGCAFSPWYEACLRALVYIITGCAFGPQSLGVSSGPGTRRACGPSSTSPLAVFSGLGHLVCLACLRPWSTSSPATPTSRFPLILKVPPPDITIPNSIEYGGGIYRAARTLGGYIIGL